MAFFYGGEDLVLCLFNAREMNKLLLSVVNAFCFDVDEGGDPGSKVGGEECPGTYECNPKNRIPEVTEHQRERHHDQPRKGGYAVEPCLYSWLGRP